MADLWHVHISSFVIAFLLPSICAGLTCLQCTDSISPRDCGRVKKCGAHEACYLDHYVTASGYIRYNLGCRDKRFCQTTAGRRSIENLRLFRGNRTNQSRNDVIRSSGDVKMCETCCDTDICNNAGCGTTGYESRQHRGPVCYTCAEQSSPETCDVISVCGKNSICKVKFKDHLGTGDVYYSSTCEDAQICHQDAQYNSVIAVGRRTLIEEVDTASHQCVVKCCDSDLCNGQCGNGGTTILSTSAPTGNQCSSRNCIHGVCQPSGSTSLCVCHSGYGGVHCGHAIHPCSSSPCAHGTCHITGQTYQCNCYTGYSGTLCDRGHVTSCPTSYTAVPLASGGNLCLYVSHAGVSLRHAQNQCQQMNNGHLVTLDTADKREAVKHFLLHKHGVSHGNVLWTGLLWNRLDGWHWHDGALISTSDQFTKSWLSAHAHPDPICAAIGMQKNGDWIKKDCGGSTHQYICEYH